MKKKLLSGILTLSMLFGIFAPMPMTVSAEPDGAAEPEEVVLEKSTQGNPIAGFDDTNNLVYAGDPSILVDGDTVYLYVGHDDQGAGGSYNMPNYLLYSTKDMKTWTYHGEIMNMKDVSWATNDSAWAAQVIKYKGKYYLLYCAERNQGGSGKCVAAAVADSPLGPFKDVGILITPDMTDATQYGRPKSFGWEDIDPTAWIDNEGKEDERIWMAWGNTNPYMCELEIDGESVKVKDVNGDGKISQGDDRATGDIWYQKNDIPAAAAGNGSGDVTFTEAPYLYRRQDANGEYYGKYYLFFATHWREEMGYATADSLEDNNWKFGGKLMEPTATSDTNHPAVFDFQGHTYFIYHNGSLAAGMGQRRVICVEELVFNEDGSIPYIQETSTGLTGFTSTISDGAGKFVAHRSFHNTLQDADYPLYDIKVNVSASADEEDMRWEMKPGKSDVTKGSYVSIESYNKPGCYLMATKTETKDETTEAKETTEETAASYGVVLAHDHNDNKKATTAGIAAESDAMTFRTLKGAAGQGVIFESVKYPGYYLTAKDGVLTLDNNMQAPESTFTVANGIPQMTEVTSVSVQKSKKTYQQGETFNLDDIRVGVRYANGTSKFLNNKNAFTVNADSIDTGKPGKQTMTVTYSEYGTTYPMNISITVMEKPKVIETDITPAKDLPKKNSVRTVGNLKYKVTKTDGYNTDGTNGTVSVTGIKNNKLTAVKIPNTVNIDGYTFKVNAIASKAFYKKSKLKTITIGSNVTSIGAKAIDGINKKAVIKVPSARYNAVKKLLNSKTGYKKTMKLKKS